MVDQMSVGLFRCALAAVLFGAATPLASRLAAETGTPALAGLLYIGAALGVAPRIRRLPRSGIRRARLALGTSVVCGGFLAPLLLVAGLGRTDAATASLLLNFELAATVVLAGVFFREHLGGRVVAGCVLVLGAGAILGWSAAPELRIGSLLIVAACVAWGVDNCVTANIVDVPPAVVTLAKGAIAGSTNVLIAAATHSQFPDATGVLAALAVGVIGYGVSITLWIQGARQIGAARGQLVFATAPFAGVAVAWLGLGDPLQARHIAGLVFAAAGAAVVLGSNHEHDHFHPAESHDHEHRHDDGHHGHDHTEDDNTHSHPHLHGELTHAHPHVPDVHHRHSHGHADRR